MYIRAIGWEVGKKDKIGFDWQKLREKQGLYSCPSVSENKKPFYCCMEVQEEKIKVISPTSCVELIDSSMLSRALCFICFGTKV